MVPAFDEKIFRDWLLLRISKERSTAALCSICNQYVINMINIDKNNVQVCTLEENESVLREKKWRGGDILIHIFRKI